MSDAAKTELRLLVKDAVAEAIKDHCRFSAAEAEALHGVAKLTPDQLIALSLFSRAVNAAAVRFATLATWAVVGAICAAIAWGVKHGMVSVE